MADLKTDTEKVEFYNKKIEELRAKAEETKDLSKVAADLVIGDARSNIFPPFGFINFIKTPDIDEKGIEKLAEQTIKGTAPYIDRLEKSAPNTLEKYGIQEEKEFLDSKANAELNSITKTDFKTIKVGIEDKEDGAADFENKSLEKLSGPDLQSILDTSILKFLKEIGVKREKEPEDNLIISKGESVMKSLETQVSNKEKTQNNPANIPVENNKNTTTQTINSASSTNETGQNKNLPVNNQNIVDKTQSNVTNNVVSTSNNKANTTNNVTQGPSIVNTASSTSVTPSNQPGSQPVNNNSSSTSNNTNKTTNTTTSNTGVIPTKQQSATNINTNTLGSGNSIDAVSSVINKELEGDPDLINKLLGDVFNVKPDAPPANTATTGTSTVSSNPTPSNSLVSGGTQGSESGNSIDAVSSVINKELEGDPDLLNKLLGDVFNVKPDTPPANTATAGTTPTASTTSTTPSVVDKVQGTSVTPNNTTATTQGATATPVTTTPSVVDKVQGTSVTQSTSSPDVIQNKISGDKTGMTSNPESLAKTINEPPVELKNKVNLTQQPQEKSTSSNTEGSANSQNIGETPSTPSTDNPASSTENQQDQNNKQAETKSKEDDKKDASEEINEQLLQVMREILKTLQGPLITTESTPRFH